MIHVMSERGYFCCGGTSGTGVQLILGPQRIMLLQHLANGRSFCYGCLAHIDVDSELAASLLRSAAIAATRRPHV